MIRPAKFADTVRIVELLEQLHGESKYASISGFSNKAAHRLIQQCIHKHGGVHEGGALVMVSVKDSRVEGFMVGILDRIYHVCDDLAANDVYLYCTDKAPVTDFHRMFKAYLSWAKHNPKVAIIKASWTDAVEGADRITTVYENEGFVKVGEIFELRVEHEDLAGLAAKALEKVG